MSSDVSILDRFFRKIALKLTKSKKTKPFPGSIRYWENRYAEGGDSGVGSYGKFSIFKSEVLNDFVDKYNVQSVIEFGCGDGNQLKLAKYPKYLGLDVSGTAISHCKRIFLNDESKSFMKVEDYRNEAADLTLSLDVIYHLVEDEVFEDYINGLFAASKRFVIIYASNTNDNTGYEGAHIIHRKFTDWIECRLTDWALYKHIPNRYPYKGDYREGSFADFYIFKKK